MLRYILFDFDGTLADSRAVFIKTFNQLADRFGFHKIGEHNLDQLHQLSMMERFRYLKVPLYKIPFLTKEFLSRYGAEITSVSLMPGMKHALESIRELGLQIGIVSSNSVHTIKGFVDANGLPVIPDIYCSGRLFGKDRLFRKFLKDKKLASAEVLYVCDELRDILSCKKVGIRPVWVSWGFEKQEALGTIDNLKIAHNTGELLDIIKQNFSNPLPA